MAGTNALVFNARRGAIKIGTPDAPRPTGMNFQFGDGWTDLGKMKKQPTVTPTATTDTTNIWQDNEEITLATSATWQIDAESAEFNLDNLKFAFNAIQDADGGLRPQKDFWEGQIALFLTNGRRSDIFWGPAGRISDLGAMDFPSTDIASVPWTVSLSEDSELGAPWKWWSTDWSAPVTAPSGD